jgi:hypothetical protein
MFGEKPVQEEPNGWGNGTISYKTLGPSNDGWGGATAPVENNGWGGGQEAWGGG